MANPVRGEKVVKFKGEDITLKITMNGLCQLEADTGKSFGKILSDLQEWETISTINMTDLRWLFWCSMLKSVPDATPTDAGDVIEEFEGNYLEFIIDAVKMSIPTSRDDSSEGK